MDTKVLAEEIVWEDLPPQLYKGKWYYMLVPFLDRPNQWGRLPNAYESKGSASGAKHRLTSGETYRPAMEESWSFEVREIEEKFYVYARYNKAVEEEVVPAPTSNGGRKRKPAKKG